MDTALIVLACVCLALVLLVVIAVLALRKKIRELKVTINNFKDETNEFYEVHFREIKTQVEHIEKCAEVMLDGLVLAQTKDKLALVKLIKKLRPLEPEVVEEIANEVAKEEEIKEEKLDPIKNGFTPID